MRNYASAIVFSCLSFMLASSAYGQKKKPYEFPEAMKEDVKKQYTEICDKGYILYNINCGNCHTRKKVIPDFESSKLAGYEIRVANAQHTSHIEEDKLTQEELLMIVTFLNFKKKSWIDLKGNKIPKNK